MFGDFLLILLTALYGAACSIMSMPSETSATTHSSFLRRAAAWPGRVVRFYVDGFRGMTVGRTLWAIIIIKLFIFFGILKLFFFPDLLKRDYDTDPERAGAVRSTLIDRSDR